MAPNPDESIAQGAAYYAYMLANKGNPNVPQLEIKPLHNYEKERKENEELNTVKMMFVVQSGQVDS